MRLQEFDGNFLSVVFGQLWCGPWSSNVGSVKGVVTQHWKGENNISEKCWSQIPGVCNTIYMYLYYSVSSSPSTLGHPLDKKLLSTISLFQEFWL